MYALLNPEDASQADDRKFATESKSLFGSILDTLGNGKAQISNFFGGDGGEVEVINNDSEQNAKTHPLPVSGNR